MVDRSPGAVVALCLLLVELPFLQQTAPPPAPPTTPAAENLTIPKTFHIAGIPGQRRNARVELVLTGKYLAFNQKKKLVLILPYERFRRVQVLDGARHYPEATYAAVLATGGIGSLLLLKKRKVDVLVIDFVNERGGQMGMVLQLPAGDGQKCKDWLAQFGITAEEPPPPTTPAKKP